ncbi:MAG TPA: sugar ABC transporter permease [Phycisphaerae bacterium]|jgi:ABC-type sugar transport system permease subunit
MSTLSTPQPEALPPMRPPSAPASLAARAKRTSHSWWAPYFFIGPFLLIFVTFVIYPLFQSLYLSTQITAGPDRSRFIGIHNYTLLAGDHLFWTALANTVYFAAGSLLLQMPCALALALLLNQKTLKGRAFFRLVFFSPYLMGLVFVGLLVNIMLGENTGLVDRLLHGVAALFGGDQNGHLLAFPWLKEYVRPALVLTALWVYTGFNMIYFLAALQNVPTELLEAAQVDGAGPWRRFWHITLPSIRPVASYITLLSLLGSFQLFELPYVLFAGSGSIYGPDDQGATIVSYLYNYGFTFGNLGRACAMGWVLAILLLIFAIGYRYLTRAEDK